MTEWHYGMKMSIDIACCVGAKEQCMILWSLIQTDNMMHLIQQDA